MKFKPESPKSHIEKTPDIDKLEGHWWKNPREALQDAWVVRAPKWVTPDYTKTGKMGIHTHPNKIEPSLPSFADLVYFNEHSMRTMVIASTDHKGKVIGYTFVAKNDKELKSKTKIYDENFIIRGNRWEEIKKEILLIQEELIDIAKVSDSEVLQKQKRLYNRRYSLAVEAEKNVKEQLASTGWRMRMVSIKGYVYKNGYFVPKPPSPPPPPSATGAVQITDAKKQEEYLRSKSANNPDKQKIKIVNVDVKKEEKKEENEDLMSEEELKKKKKKKEEELERVRKLNEYLRGKGGNSNKQKIKN